MRHQLVEDYLGRLRDAAAMMPPTRREELVSEIEAHVEEGQRAAGDNGDGAVRTLLDRLGPPEEIVAAAMADERPAAQPAAITSSPGLPVRDLAAVILLPLGGFLYVVGWLVGVLLLWSSPNWTARHKVIGTLVLPLGCALPLLLGAVLPGKIEACSSGGVIDAETGRRVSEGTVCTSEGFSLPPWLGAVVFGMLLVSPIVTAIWLATKAHAYRRVSLS